MPINPMRNISAEYITHCITISHTYNDYDKFKKDFIKGDIYIKELQYEYNTLFKLVQERARNNLNKQIEKLEQLKTTEENTSKKQQEEWRTIPGYNKQEQRNNNIEKEAQRKNHREKLQEISNTQGELRQSQRTLEYYNSIHKDTLAKMSELSPLEEIELHGGRRREVLG